MAEAPSAGEAPRFERLVLFDGVCAFCDAGVRWLIDRDPEARLRFAPIQGETAAELRARHPTIPRDLETMVLVEREDGQERVYLRSEAVFRTHAAISGGPRWIGWLARLPRPLTDLAYRIFVRLRYRLFGRLDACRVPTPDERGRFLD